MSSTFAFAAVYVRGTPVRADVAPLLAGLLEEYRALHGEYPPILEGGRTRERQTFLWDGWVARLPGFNTAAPPGKSRHEFGDAVDFGYPFNSYTSIAWARLAAIAPAWGFTNTEGRNTKPRPEAWHWVCNPRTATKKPPALAAAGEIEVLLSTDAILDRVNQIHDYEQLNGAAFPRLREAMTAAAKGVLDRVNQIHNFEQTNPKAFPFLLAAVQKVLDRMNQIHDYEQLNGEAFPHLRDAITDLSAHPEYGLKAIAEAAKAAGSPVVSVKVDAAVFGEALKIALADQATTRPLVVAISDELAARMRG